MTLGILGRKVGMTHRFDDKGSVTPVTVIKAGPCTVVQKKDLNKDQYHAIQIGYEDIKDTRVNKPLNGHFAKSNVKPKRFLKEIRLTEEESAKYKEGDKIKVDDFENCEFIDVTGLSKGRGFTGVIKRHNFHMPKMTHGTHEKFRHGGSLGCRFPQRVFKGKKMAGHYGHEKTTVQNLKIHSIIKDENLILVKGSIPGPNNGVILVKTSLKKPAKA